MEDLDSLREFIDNSELPLDIKKALLDCIYLEMRNSPISEYQKLAIKYSEI